MVHFLFALSFFFFWACAGSFCGVLMETDLKRSFWTGRSQCLSCNKKLRWFELVPLISYIFQRGKCLSCGHKIPPWLLNIEALSGLVWMFFWSLFFYYWYSAWVIGSHLTIITMLLMLAIEDIKTFTIPDRLSLPMIIIVAILIGFSIYFADMWLLFSLKEAFLGSVIGMLFYLVQMILPGIFSLWRKNRFTDILSLLLVPFVFPFWLIAKILFWEKNADRWIPSIEKMDQLPSWVWGGDVRLGILIGMIVWPVYFWWVIGIGYVIGTLFWLFVRSLGKKDLDILPVAPLLFLGFCTTLVIRIFS